MRCLLLLITVYSVNCWVWECVGKTGTCERIVVEKSSDKLVYPSIEVCRLVCGNEGNIWPKPQNFTQTDKSLVYIDATNAIFTAQAPSDGSTKFLLNLPTYFKKVVNSFRKAQNCKEKVYGLEVHLQSTLSTTKLNWTTSEEYNLSVTTYDKANTVFVNISGATVFAVRHGVETLLQLIETDQQLEETCCYVTLKGVNIHDAPYYRHRGLLLDSARNYLSVDVIKKNIEAMAMSKLNVLHWHLSDTQSFPFVSWSLPNMSKYGAYGNDRVYETHQIKDLIEFAKERGVRIIPEIDGPAHAGNGWQWGPEAGLGNLVVCHNAQPWKSFCIQPPCGQMNPANPKLYDVLQALYSDISLTWPELYEFHMGGDEVYFPCWNSSAEILNYLGYNRSEEAFLNLWKEFQQKAVGAFDSVHQDNNASIILWTSKLTEPTHIESYLPKERYVIQTWVPQNDALPEELINLGYKLIISTKDSWYLDHGFWGSTQYYPWTKIYDNKILTHDAVLGGEVCMWGELVDDNNVEPRVWPRAAAAAERLWTNPITKSKQAGKRFFIHNHRLARRGIRTAALAPKYCTQNEAECDIS